MAIRFDDAARTVHASVHDLVAVGWTDGNLRVGGGSGGGRLRAGREAHRAFQKLRTAEDEQYRAEVTAQRTLRVGEWTLVVSGRIDGLARESGRPVVEEVKSSTWPAERLLATSREDWADHVAQLQLYLWLVAAEGEEPYGRLVFVSLADGSRHSLGVAAEFEFVERKVREIGIYWVRNHVRQQDWLQGRAALAVPEPFSNWRPGQPELSRAVTHALDASTAALVVAATGSGKTGAVLYGALVHAVRSRRQIVWVTARNTQQAGVAAMAAKFVAAGFPLRWTILAARERACIQESLRCHPEDCGFSRGYHEKLRSNDAVWQARDQGIADLASLREVGAACALCPYELNLDVSAYVDLVIADYNYVFHPDGYLRRFFAEEEGERWVVIVDEAHQLPERARDYLSAALRSEDLEAARASLAGVSGVESLVEVVEDVQAELNAATAIDGVEELVSPPVEPWCDFAEVLDEALVAFAVAVPGAPVDHPWLRFARSVQAFSQALAEPEARRVIARIGVGRRELVVRCLDASAWLAERHRCLGGWIGLSATLSPVEFYRPQLGLPASAEFVRVPPFFDPRHRKVVVVPRISTAYRDREREAEPTARLLVRCIQAVPGNCAVYFSSFAMLDDIVARADLGERRWLRQSPSMSVEARASLLAELSDSGAPVALAAVLGGVFAEGIDLPAGALSAVFVCGPALPPVGLEQNLLVAYYHERFGDGFHHAAVIPGMTRVIQAAGRLVRRETDRGVVALLDRRFRWRGYASLLPPDWQVEVPEDPVAAIRSFWSEA